MPRWTIRISDHYDTEMYIIKEGQIWYRDQDRGGQEVKVEVHDLCEALHDMVEATGDLPYLRWSA